MALLLMNLMLSGKTKKFLYLTYRLWNHQFKFFQKSQRSSVICYQVLEMTIVKGKGIFKGSVMEKKTIKP